MNFSFNKKIGKGEMAHDEADIQYLKYNAVKVKRVSKGHKKCRECGKRNTKIRSMKNQ